MKYRKIIKKWAKLRHPDKKFADTAIKLYESYDERDRKAMLFEFQNYIQGVESGTIVPSTPKIPIRVFKKQTTEQELKDYYEGKENGK